MLRTRDFRRYLTGMLIYNLPFAFPVPFYQVFNLEVLKMSKSLIAVMWATYFAIKLVTLPFWGRRAGRLGARRTLTLIGPLYVAFFVLMAMSTEGRVWPIFVAWSMAAAGDAAFLVATQTALYRAVPDDAPRPAYFAVANLMTFAMFGVCALLGVPLLNAMEKVQVSVGIFTLGRYHLMMAGCAVVMIPCIFGARLFPSEARRTTARDAS